MRKALAIAAVLGLSACGTTKTLVQTPSTPLIPYRVPSGSMDPTLSLGSYVYYEAATPRPQVGDIAVFHPPERAEEEECGPTPHTITLGGAACAQPIEEESQVDFIKRIVAGPGEELYFTEGHVYKRSSSSGPFVRERDSYIKACGTSPECDFPTPIKVPAGDWYMLGDNRGESDDSRFWGPVPTGWIIGIVRWCGKVGLACPTFQISANETVPGG